MIENHGNELSARERLILKAVVHRYINSAEAVSSKILMQNYNLNLSSSSIRLVLNKLEKAEYIYQPYISAGRIPTNVGYQFYIQYVMEERPLPREVFDIIQRRLQDKQDSFEKMLNEVVYVISDISNQIAFGITPILRNCILTGMDLIQINDFSIVLIISFSNSYVKTVKLRFPKRVRSRDLESTISVLQEILLGKKLSILKDNFLEIIKDHFTLNNLLIDYINRNKEDLFCVEKADKLIMHGAKKAMSKPEFADAVNLSSILQCFDDKEKMMEVILENTYLDGISISFGKGDEKSVYNELSFISSPYQYFSSKGLIGVFGPRRMKYSLIIPTLNSISRIMMDYLEE